MAGAVREVRGTGHAQTTTSRFSPHIEHSVKAPPGELLVAPPPPPSGVAPGVRGINCRKQTLFSARAQ